MEDVLFGSASNEVRHGVEIPVLLLTNRPKDALKVLLIGVDLAWGEKMHDGVCFVELDLGEGWLVLDIHKEIGI